MRLPIEEMSYPSVLTGQSNGRLPDSLLVTIPAPGGGTLRLLRVAAPAFGAMLDAAARAGHRLMATSPLDSYRPYAEQEALFRRRYQTTPIPGVAPVSWNGRSWWLKRGLATAAIPGTSNHGKGLAVDLGEQRDTDPTPEPLSDAALAWLVAHAHEYGISAELQSEPWHWRYYAGNNPPPAVTIHTGLSTEETPMRYLFASDVPGVPEAAQGRIHITTGVTYRIQGKVAAVNKLHDRAGASPIVTVTKADLPAGWDYNRFVPVLCGVLDHTGTDDDDSGPVDLDAVTQAARDGARSALDGATLHTAD